MATRYKRCNIETKALTGRIHSVHANDITILLKDEIANALPKHMMKKYLLNCDTHDKEAYISLVGIVMRKTDNTCTVSCGGILASIPVDGTFIGQNVAIYLKATKT